MSHSYHHLPTSPDDEGGLREGLDELLYRAGRPARDDPLEHLAAVEHEDDDAGGEVLAEPDRGYDGDRGEEVDAEDAVE